MAHFKIKWLKQACQTIHRNALSWDKIHLTIKRYITDKN